MLQPTAAVPRVVHRLGFADFQKLRNQLVHFTPQSYSTFYTTSTLMPKTEKAIATAAAVIKAIYSSLPSSPPHPQTFDEFP